MGADEPVAVIGMACRLPGADHPEAFWQMLRDGAHAVGAVLPSRSGGEMAEMALGGAFVEDVDRFDAEFFAVSDREAEMMDPQQRLILELGWEALEDAGVVPGHIRGSQAGVFVGVMSGDYATLVLRQGLESLTEHSLTGLGRNMVANRLSFFLGTTGPSLAVDTAQSSSLVAVHLACESLRRGECGMALAGGVSLNLAEESAAAVAKIGALSPDSRCFAFDARANGYVRGEGAGIVVLKLLSLAVADGDPVICVVRGSAVTSGWGERLTVPSQDAQQDVLRLAYRRSGVAPREVQYVELHGTGTPVGDPIEARALGAVVGLGRPADAPLLVGSAKTNVGHLEAAAGIVGLIKVALAIGHAQLPASLNYESPNPAIALDELGIRVHTALTPWPDGRPRMAGVSSFGLGGTNCHVVVAEPGTPPGVGRVAKPSGRSALVPWLVSGTSETALRAQALRLAAFVDAHHGLDVVDVGYSLAATRTCFDHRAVVLARDPAGFACGLTALAASQTPARVVGLCAGDRPLAEHLLEVAAGAHVVGVNVDWELVFAPWHPRRVRLPTYAFQRRRHWLATLLRPPLPAPPRGEDRDADLTSRLRNLPENRREGLLLDVVVAQAATVLGPGKAGRIDPGRTFNDLGVDSITALQFRDRLNTATGLCLPVTVVFDHPTPRTLACYLQGRFSNPAVDAPPSGADAEMGGAGIDQGRIDEMSAEDLIGLALSYRAFGAE